ncbi:outer membrane beta-barrel protein [Phaeodactylibacter sp.]|uniref:outer membrane beta-barrel protein n=1 Tax=Phaeodactylibacter sp. TaxID=1940289 RepID=UPI0025ED6134|nr:outer membrane beta-barrel protein [Phaeodactylibacter sp.]MCI5056711.1 PorT family protein [Flavobacteriales bacterium]MCI5093496.1 PorT family protein [Phaeodactylibacter sp.]
MKLLKIKTTIFILLIANISYSQINLGVEIGKSYYSWLIHEESDFNYSNFDQTMKNGISVSAFIEKKIKDICIRSELSFKRKGSIVSASELLIDTGPHDSLNIIYNHDINVDYFEFSLLLNQTGLKGDKFEFNALFGPSIGFGLGGNEYSTLIEDSSNRDDRIATVDQKIDFDKSSFKRWDLGFKLGFEWVYLFKEDFSIFFSPKYQVSITNFNKIEDNTGQQLRNSGFTISLGAKMLL